MEYAIQTVDGSIQYENFISYEAMILQIKIRLKLTHAINQKPNTIIIDGITHVNIDSCGDVSVKGRMLA